MGKFELLLIHPLHLSANKPTTSWFMVSSIPHHSVYGSSIPAIGCCFTFRVTNASGYGSATGKKVSCSCIAKFVSVL